MEIQTLENRPKIITRPEMLIKGVSRKESKVDNFKSNPAFLEIIEEVGQDVFDYLDRFGVTLKSNVLFLSFSRHYFYDADDLKNADSIINFRLVNRIAHINHYMQAINKILLIDGYYAGCFLDYKNQRQNITKGSHSILGHIFLFIYRFLNRIVPKIPVLNWIQHLFNQGKVKCLTTAELKGLMRKNGFDVMSMEDVDGLTYFIARKSENINPRVLSVFQLINHFKTK